MFFRFSSLQTSAMTADGWREFCRYGVIVFNLVAFVALSLSRISPAENEQEPNHDKDSQTFPGNAIALNIDCLRPGQ